jgi:6-phosphogluconolactonase (cycloisomerase 2 family)
MDNGMIGGEGAVFVQTNEPDNAVIAFRRSANGRLVETGRYPTGGKGDGNPHLPSQGSVTLSGDGRHLLVANVASDDVTLFAVEGDRLTHRMRTTVAEAPRSIAERDGIVAVLATGKPGVVGLRLVDGGLEAIPGAEQMLPATDADPAQVGFTPDGSRLLVTERGTDAITTIELGADGMFGAVRSIASAGPTPYGFASTSDGRVIVTEAFRAAKGEAAASSYRLGADGPTLVTASVGNGRSEICWAVITPDDRFAFTTNFADGAVSRYAIAADGSLVLEDATAGLTVDGLPGLRDEDLSEDGRWLYVVDADQGRVAGWSVDADGALAWIGSWGGLPTTVAGLAAR